MTSQLLNANDFLFSSHSTSKAYFDLRFVNLLNIFCQLLKVGAPSRVNRIPFKNKEKKGMLAAAFIIENSKERAAS